MKNGLKLRPRIPTKEARHVANYLYKIILRHGCPVEIVSDQGREFCNWLIDLLKKLTGLQAQNNQCLPPSIQWVGWAIELNAQIEATNPCKWPHGQLGWAYRQWFSLCIYQVHTISSDVWLWGTSANRSIGERICSEQVDDEKVKMLSWASSKSALKCKHQKSSGAKKKKKKKKFDDNTKLKFGDKVLVKDMNSAGRKGGKLNKLFG